jgi:hypothetical protein
MDEKLLELHKVCAPIVEYLKKFNPHTTVVITDSYIKLEETQMYIRVEP